MSGLFDDLIPAKPAGQGPTPQDASRARQGLGLPNNRGNIFADLMPSKPAANPFAGMSDDQARATIAALPEGQRKEALDLWADAYVNAERQNEGIIGGAIRGVNDTVRGLARGTVVGSWLDEANALSASALGGDYEETLAYQRARDRRFDEDNPVASTGLQIAGGVGNAMVAGPAILGAAGKQAASLGGQMLRGAGAGVGSGAIYGAGMGEDATERARQAVFGAGIGGVVGGVAPAVARGVGNAVSYGTKSLQRKPAAIRGFEGNAVRKLADIVKQANLDKPTVARTLADLGDEAMAADIARPLQSQLGGIASTQTGGAQIAADAIFGRDARAVDRITQSVDKALGPKRNVPKLMQSLEARFKATAKPLYDQFRATPVPFTREVENLLDVLKNEPGILKDARRYANLENALGSGGPKQFFADIADDGTVSIMRVPNATEWDYIKRALSGRAYGQGVTENDKRIFSGLSRMVRDTIDEAISPGAPEQSIWARARAVAADEFELTEALKNGKSAFSKGLSPDEMAEEMVGMSQAEREAYRIGARQSIRDTMENSGTKFGPNEDTAAMRLLGTRAAREKVDLIEPGASRELSRALDAEARFAGTSQNVMQNSKTSERTAAQQTLPVGARPGERGAGLSNTTATGLALEVGARTFNALRAGAMKEAAEKEVADMARMLTAQGVKAGDIVNALIDYNKQQGASKLAGDVMSRMVRAIIRGSQQSMIEQTRERR